MKTKLFVKIGALVLVLVSCSNRLSNKTDIQSIYFLYFNHSFSNIKSVDCCDIKKKCPTIVAFPILNESGDSCGVIIDNHGVIDTTIVDTLILMQFKNELCKLHPDPSNYPIDARISCIIRYKNKKEERICIGGYFADGIEYNGIRQERNNKLLYLIKKYSGYYFWMGDRILEYSVELQDKSFQRDSVTGYSGRKF